MDLSRASSAAAISAAAAVFLFLALGARASVPTSANFLSVGAGARPVALGEAYAGLADDGYAAVYNPAGLAGLRRQEASFAFNRHLEGVAQQELHYALPTASLGTFALSATSLQVSPFAGYDVDDQPAGKISAQDLAVGAQYAASWGPLMLGAGGKFLDSRLADAHARGMAWDAGVLYQAGKAVRLGASATNLGQGLKYERESFPLPRVLRFGASGRMDLIGKSYLILMAQAALPNDRDPYPAAGLEFCREELFALRAGYTGRLDAGLGLSVGGGLKLIQNGRSWYSASTYSSSMPDVEVDYAFLPMAALGDTHRIGLVMRFGQDKDADHFMSRTPDKDEVRPKAKIPKKTLKKNNRTLAEPEALYFYQSL